MAATMAEDGTVTFSTGTTEYYSGGLCSISENGSVYEGYDLYYGEISSMPEIERRELAELMIARWAKFGGIDISRLAT